MTYRAVGDAPGKDTVLEAASSSVSYRANTLRSRVIDDRLHAVLGFNAASSWRIELGLVSEDKSDSHSATPTKAHGVRPTVICNTGAGLSASYAFTTDGNVNVNCARLTTDGTTWPMPRPSSRRPSATQGQQYRLD